MNWKITKSCFIKPTVVASTIKGNPRILYIVVLDQSKGGIVGIRDY